MFIDFGDHRMVSYADFITLLFAFFVVLYASSQVDKRRVGKLSFAIQVAFQELGVFATSNTRVPLSNSEAVPFSQVQAVENIERTSDMQRFVQRMKGILSPAAAAGPRKDIQAELEKALAPEIRSPVADIKTRKEGPTMRASSVDSIDRLAAVLASRGENMRIEGLH